MPLSCRSNYTKLFTGSNKDQLIKPNFKLPDPVYDPPKFEANGKTIVTTPSTLTEPYRVCRRPLFLRECPDEKSKIHP